MHAYSTDSRERQRITFALAILSYIVARIFLISIALLNIELVWWIEPPSVFALYGLFYYIFDRCVWKIKLLSKFKIVNMPDLNGVWSGTLSSSWDKFASEKAVKIEINQSWTKIMVELETDQSTSRSISASLLVHDLAAPRLCYEYINEPRPDAPNTSHPHRGYARLDLDSETLNGDYFNGRNRGTFGVIDLERI